MGLIVSLRLRGEHIPEVYDGSFVHRLTVIWRDNGEIFWQAMSFSGTIFFA
jgi:hypothetical protein